VSLRRVGLVLSMGTLLGLGGPAMARPLRVLSLDQCADQYVLALAPDADLFLSPRADDPDSWLRRAAAGRAQVRPSLEAAIGVRPDVVVRYWGGDTRMLGMLEDRGARILTIVDATDMRALHESIDAVAAGLDRRENGRRLLLRMDRRLTQAGQPSPRSRGSALYLTAGGFTAGRDTLMDAILRAAGYANLAGITGFGAISVERIALRPPDRFVLGFFDQVRSDWRGAGRHPVVRRAARGRVAADLPAASLTCPAWFAADAAAMIATAQRTVLE